MKLQKLAGATSEIWQVFIRDSSSTTGGGLTGLVFNSAGLTAYYHRDVDTTATVISLVTMTVGTFTSSGFKEIDAANMPGWYQFCPPNAAIAAGAKSCGFHLKGATNMAPLPIEVQLLAVNVDDAVRMGMTALPNAAAEAAGGLYTRGTGAGQINQDANGRVDVNGKAWAGGAIPAPNVTGVPIVDDKYLLGTIYSTPATAGIQDINVINWKGSAAAAMTGDAYARLGAPAGASVSADVAAMKVDTAAIKVQTDKVTFTVANQVDVNVVDWKGAAAPAMTGDAFARLGAAGAGLTALGDTRIAHLDVDVSSRSTYSGADTAGTTTLLSRLTNTRAGLLDNLDAGISASFVALASHGDGAWATATGFSTLDATDVETAVWDATAASHVTSGTFGAAIDTLLSEVGTIEGRIGTPAFGDLAGDIAHAQGVVDGIDGVTSKLDDTLEDDSGTFRFTANALAQAPTGGAAPSASAIADEVQTRTIAAVTLVNGLAANSVTAAALAADAGTEIGTAVWGTTTRLLTAGTNIALAKGTGVTGFNDLSAAQVNAEADAALADVGVTTTVTGRIDAAITTRLASGGYTAPDNATIAAIDGKATTILAGVVAIDSKTTNLPSDPADQSLVIAATNAIMTAVGDVPTAGANAAALLAAAFEGAETVQDFLRLSRAALYGKADGLEGTTVHFRDAADTKDRITATVDSDGNRDVVTTDAT